MSEYQYYEFQAIDRPLTAEEMSELRSRSTRARITPTSFVNDYAWGHFKGNEDAWMERYFDAFVYLANWGTHVLKLRLPKRLLDVATAKKYGGGDDGFVHETTEKVILTFMSQEDSEWVEGAGCLCSMVSVRDELARNDLRALYLAWLVPVQTGELRDEELEPPVPPGLGRLSPALESLAQFLRIDGDLLHAAAEMSQPRGNSDLDPEHVRTWVRKLPSEDTERLLAAFIVDADPTLVSELQQRYLKESVVAAPGPPVSRRTVAQLRRAAGKVAEERMRIEAETRAKEDARREREAAVGRKQHLDRLVGREPKLWIEVGSLIASTQPRNYDQAVRILVDLRDLDERTKTGQFPRRLEALRQMHARKRAFIERLSRAGL